MTDFLDRSGLPRLAYNHRPGTAPTIVFLPGYASNMAGAKALAIDEWAARTGQALLRLDYRGCGESAGVFAESTLDDWRDDALDLIDTLTAGPIVLVGSSMGGWLMLLITLERHQRVVGMIGLAAAPDFTDWGFTMEQKLALLQNGRIEQPSDYSDQPTVTTRAFWASGEANRMMVREIEYDGPVRLLQGQKDKEVPWERAAALAQRFRSDAVQTVLVKDGDHRLSRDQDLPLIVRALEDVIALCSSPSSS
jgi:pimeloyl-ACP methyl ester carboxylesterase